MVQPNGTMAGSVEHIDESLKRHTQAEGEAAINHYKKINPFSSSLTSATALKSSQPHQSNSTILDLFGGEEDGGAASHSPQSRKKTNKKTLDGLFQLVTIPFASPTGSAPVIPPLPGSWATPSHNGKPHQSITVEIV